MSGRKKMPPALMNKFFEGEQLTDEEDSIDGAHWTDNEYSTDHVDEIDEEDANTQTDNTQDVLPFAGFTNAATGKPLPIPNEQELARVKTLFGFDIENTEQSTSSSVDSTGKNANDNMYSSDEICFRRAGSGEKWL